MDAYNANMVWNVLFFGGYSMGALAWSTRQDGGKPCKGNNGAKE